eukprot:CAMPEP_0201521466 /NCGR_PEP_ID=MMETSP0161_2-20130828/14438_1 /ASSEMBLY_ACC=CAM_ASM_000251 /TAXON_ID=180227 /ORGANISM="Neoparamoeba aestuarina, Strain SoJaBio B1-5/56/2" /LENGTH=461 /DNA_ID=CAMNT_0047920107 /DNA_START=45 /DNA_END=1430 /DNA_ORIENTATION=-
MAAVGGKLAERFIKFVDASPSPFHAVLAAKQLLETHGFKHLSEKNSWQGLLQQGGKYFFTRNMSTIVAFAVGNKYAPGNGFRIIGAHTDSPCLKLKPHPCDTGAEGYKQVGVQTYGGGLWYSWFDRDLKLAGRVIVRNSEQKKLEQKFVHVDRPLLRVPSLAIHLNRTVNTEGFKFNTETELTPVIATTLGAEAAGSDKPVLLEVLSKELDVDISSIVDYDLCLADFQPSTIGGAFNEFVFAPRLDNLLCSFTSLEALVDACDAQEDEDFGIRMCILFDNEEIGSNSYAGAGSSLVDTVMSRVVGSLSEGTYSDEVVHRAYRNSFLISADMAHAVHPNYGSRHEANHKPEIHKGLVVKVNANMRYATTAASAAPLRELAHRRNVPIQEFVVRNDSGCGSTIGPMLSARGLRTVDVGQPQLSMHSIREMCGVSDLEHTKSLFFGFYGPEFAKIDNDFAVDES